MILDEIITMTAPVAEAQWVDKNQPPAKVEELEQVQETIAMLKDKIEKLDQEKAKKDKPKKLVTEADVNKLLFPTPKEIGEFLWGKPVKPDKYFSALELSRLANQPKAKSRKQKAVEQSQDIIERAHGVRLHTMFENGDRSYYDPATKLQIYVAAEELENSFKIAKRMLEDRGEVVTKRSEIENKILGGGDTERINLGDTSMGPFLIRSRNRNYNLEDVVRRQQERDKVKFEAKQNLIRKTWA